MLTTYKVWVSDLSIYCINNKILFDKFIQSYTKNTALSIKVLSTICAPSMATTQC